MSHTPHELAEEFPRHAALISVLKASDSRFSRLAEEYHQVNRSVHRAETKVDPIGTLYEQELRKKRLALKDQIWQMISAAQ